MRSEDQLPVRRVAGVEYLACEWCGEPVSQLGTRAPRRYCKRSHRQRAYEERRYGDGVRQEDRRVSKSSPAPAAGEQLLPVPAPASEERVLLPDPPAAAPVVIPLPTPKGKPRLAAVAEDVEEPVLFDLPPVDNDPEAELARRLARWGIVDPPG